MRSPTLILLLLGVTLAGCSDDTPDADDVLVPLDPDAVASEDGRDLRTDLEINDSVGAPSWHVGQAWKQTLAFAGGENVAWTAVVAEDRGGQWLVAVAEKDVAAYHAVYDFADFGLFDKRTLDTTSGGAATSWYGWPLAHGTTWQETYTVTDMYGNTTDYTVEYVAAYDEAIATPLGKRPGYAITGTTTDGSPFAEYDYTPAVGWFSAFTGYDPATGEVSYTIETTEAISGYTGVYYVDEAELVLEHVFDSGSQTVAPPASFAVAEGATYVYGYAWYYAGGGAAGFQLVDPNGGAQGQHTGPEALTAGGGGYEEYFLDAVAGDWRFAAAGAGAFAGGGGGMFWQVTEAEAILAAEEPEGA